MTGDAWAVVLAGGDGTRLRPLARLLFRSELPKQYLPLLDGRSLLQATLRRIAPLFAPERTIVVVSESHLEVASRQIGPYGGVRLIAQPKNLGTAPGLLLPLARIQALEPKARIAVFPSDHHIPNPGPLLRGIANALRSRRHDRILFGVVPTEPVSDLGWIVPRPRQPVAETPVPAEALVEKPSRAVADDLYRRGALWNTFIMSGTLAAFWGMARRRVPRLVAPFDAYATTVGTTLERAALVALYSQLEPSDFSRDVLQGESGLATVLVRGTGWSDWGTPERLLRGLRETAGPSAHRLSEAVPA